MGEWSVQFKCFLVRQKEDRHPRIPLDQISQVLNKKQTYLSFKNRAQLQEKSPWQS